MKAHRLAIAAALLGLLAASGPAAELTVWELPRARGLWAGSRKEWKPATASSRFAGGLAVENGRLTVLIPSGARGPILRPKGTDVSPGIGLRILGADGAAARVAETRLVESDQTEAVARFKTGTADVELVLRVGAAHVELRPGRNATGLEARARARYAVIPRFGEDDRLLDPTRHAPDTLPVRAENVLVQLLEGEEAMVLLTWRPPPDATDQGAKPRKAKVELLAAGRGPSRRFTACRVELLGGSVYVARLHEKDLWHEAKLRGLPGAKTTRVGWTRPFEARWRADFVMEGFDDKEVAAFLRLAAELGLSKGHERTWQAAYPKGEGDVDTESRNFRTAARAGKLPRYSPWGPEGGDLAWPCVFRGKETLVTLPARWPGCPGPTEGRLERVQKQRAAEGKEPLFPIHEYRRVVIYPIDRTQETPLAAYTVVDVMRQTLGIGPCNWDWLEKRRR